MILYRDGKTDIKIEKISIDKKKILFNLLQSTFHDDN